MKMRLHIDRFASRVRARAVSGVASMVAAVIVAACEAGDPVRPMAEDPSVVFARVQARLMLFGYQRSFVSPPCDGDVWGLILQDGSARDSGFRVTVRRGAFVRSAVTNAAGEFRTELPPVADTADFARSDTTWTFIVEREGRDSLDMRIVSFTRGRVSPVMFLVADTVRGRKRDRISTVYVESQPRWYCPERDSLHRPL